MSRTAQRRKQQRKAVKLIECQLTGHVLTEKKMSIVHGKYAWKSWCRKCRQYVSTDIFMDEF